MAPEIAPVYLIDDDRWFTPLERMNASGGAHRLSQEALPSGWERKCKAVWTHLQPAGSLTPEQGWKIHVSSTSEHYQFTVDEVWEICRELRIYWKFISHPALHRAMNGKGATRGASGKAITIYPRDEQQLGDLLHRLETRLEGIEGPYILSDIRWKDTPVYLRYGGFATMWCFDSTGNRVLALKDPDGRLVPDVRGPMFAPPEWVSMPRWLTEGTGYERRERTDDPRLHGYRVLSSLHFSNAGGVYLAEDAEGHKAVVKEARPHAGIDANGQDAVTRLHHEEQVLRALADCVWAPNVIDAFTEWEHHYLVLEYLEGETLDAIIRREYPLTRSNSTPDRRSDYLATLRPLLLDLERIIGELHERGHAFGDLTPNNVMVVDGGTRIALLDFESAKPLTSTQPPDLFTRGFLPDRPMPPEAADWYAFACCQLWAFAPFNRLAQLKPEALGEAVDAMSEWFDLPRDELVLTRSRLRVPDSSAVQPRRSRPALRELVPGIVAAARPEDAVQLYPGDMRSLDDSARLGLAYGASGVVLALLAAGERPPVPHVEWLRRAVESASSNVPLGLYDGLGGAALALYRLSDPLYQKVVDRILEAPAPEGIDLFSGRIGLAHLLIEVGEARAGLDMAETVRASLAAAGNDTPVGLTNGLCGAAVLFARCRNLTGDDSWTEAHLTAVDRVLVADRPTQRSLSTGLAGFVLALLSGSQWQTDRHRSELQGLLDDMDVEVMPQGGLFGGHAGVAYAFGQASRVLPEQSGRAQALAQAQLRSAGRYIGRAGTEGAALIGRQAARFSLDLGTGSAGVVFAERAVTAPQTYQLPGMELYEPVNDRR